MLDLSSIAHTPAAELLSGRGVGAAGPVLAPSVLSTSRPRAYLGPERRVPASSQARRMAQMLDTLDYGMLLVTQISHVSHVNKAARRDLDHQHPLLIEGGQLQTRLAQDSLPLREALLGAAQRGLRRLLQLGEGRQRISVAVVPLAAQGTDDPPGATVLLGKRQVCEELTVDWFARSHSLTPTESAVMKGLCADLTPLQIAERQGVGLATIRTQIGSIRLKTGASSIRALVRQVALLPPLVGALQSWPTAPAVASAGRGGDRLLNS